MPTIVIVDSDGKVVYQDTVKDAGRLVRSIRDITTQPGLGETGSKDDKDGVIVLVRQPPGAKPAPPRLTPKQTLVLRCLANSLSPGQTALKMGLSEESVRSYIKILKRKFNTNSRDQLMAMAGYLGLCDPYKDEA